MLGFLEAAELERLFDQGREVLLAVGVRADVRLAGVFDDGRREDAVGVRVLRRHDAVRRKEDRRGKVLQFLLLVLPGRAEVTLEVRVLAKGRIGVAGEHFAVRVDVDALVLRGFKEKREVVEVVTRHDDEGAGFHRERDARGFGVAVGFGVGLVEQRHRLEVDAARFHEKAEERVDFGDAADGVERLEVEGVDFVGRVPENAGRGRRRRRSP